MKGQEMTAILTPEGFPHIFAQDVNTIFFLDKPTAGFVSLVLIARRMNKDETRLPLTSQTITKLIDFINNCRESFAGRIAENGFLFLAENGRFEISLGSRRIVMSQQNAYQLADTLSAYPTQDRDTCKNRT
jgi:hypothetical protein